MHVEEAAKRLQYAVNAELKEGTVFAKSKYVNYVKGDV